MLDPNGKEHNLQFAIENWWIGDIGSFHSEEPSRFYIEANRELFVFEKVDDDWKIARYMFNKTSPQK